MNDTPIENGATLTLVADGGCWGIMVPCHVCIGDGHINAAIGEKQTCIECSGSGELHQLWEPYAPGNITTDAIDSELADMMAEVERERANVEHERRETRAVALEGLHRVIGGIEIMRGLVASIIEAYELTDGEISAMDNRHAPEYLDDGDTSGYARFTPDENGGTFGCVLIPIEPFDQDAQPVPARPMLEPETVGDDDTFIDRAFPIIWGIAITVVILALAVRGALYVLGIDVK